MHSFVVVTRFLEVQSSPKIKKFTAPLISFETSKNNK